MSASNDHRSPYVEKAAWVPWIGYQFGRPDRMYLPASGVNGGARQPLAGREDLKRLVNLVRDAEGAGKQVHAVGTGWSFTSCAFTSDYMVTVAGQSMNEILPLEQLRIPEEVRRKAVFTHGGCKMDTVMDHLEANGQALPSFAASCGQTMAGLISTGSHGAQPKDAPPGDFVLGMMIIAEGGKAYWLQRANGPVAAGDVPFERFAGEVISDDDVMDAAILSLGCFGIIYAVLTEVRPMYWLAARCEEMTLAPDFEFLAPAPALKAILDEPGIRFVEWVINPFPTKPNGGHLAHLSTYRDAPHGTDLPAVMPLHEQASLLMTIGKDALNSRLFPGRLAAQIPTQVDKIIAKTRPLSQGKTWVGKCHAFIARGQPPLKVACGEVTFPRAKMPEVMRAVARWTREGLQEKRPFALAGAICLRYQAASRATLATFGGFADGRFHDTSIEIFAIQTIFGMEETRARIQQQMDQLQEMGGVAHWGKLHGPRKEVVEKAFGAARLEKWRSAYRRLNPTRRTFENGFVHAAGLLG